jgi:hypothetical protein
MKVMYFLQPLLIKIHWETNYSYIVTVFCFQIAVIQQSI